jgi:hypothetical protein
MDVLGIKWFLMKCSILSQARGKMEHWTILPHICYSFLMEQYISQYMGQNGIDPLYLLL